MKWADKKLVLSDIQSTGFKMYLSESRSFNNLMVPNAFNYSIADKNDTFILNKKKYILLAFLLWFCCSYNYV